MATPGEANAPRCGVRQRRGSTPRTERRYVGLPWLARQARATPASCPDRTDEPGARAYALRGPDSQFSERLQTSEQPGNRSAIAEPLETQRLLRSQLNPLEARDHEFLIGELHVSLPPDERVHQRCTTIGRRRYSESRRPRMPRQRPRRSLAVTPARCSRWRRHAWGRQAPGRAPRSRRCVAPVRGSSATVDATTPPDTVTEGGRGGTSDVRRKSGRVAETRTTGDV